MAKHRRNSKAVPSSHSTRLSSLNQCKLKLEELEPRLPPGDLFGSISQSLINSGPLVANPPETIVSTRQVAKELWVRQENKLSLGEQGKSHTQSILLPSNSSVIPASSAFFRNDENDDVFTLFAQLPFSFSNKRLHDPGNSLILDSGRGSPSGSESALSRNSIPEGTSSIQSRPFSENQSFAQFLGRTLGSTGAEGSVSIISPPRT
ncbi:MAG: hypothetical protein ACKO23_17125, partial [Gemmataceae bacterium]